MHTKNGYASFDTKHIMSSLLSSLMSVFRDIINVFTGSVGSILGVAIRNTLNPRILTYPCVDTCKIIVAQNIIAKTKSTILIVDKAFAFFKETSCWVISDLLVIISLSYHEVGQGAPLSVHLSPFAIISPALQLIKVLAVAITEVVPFTYTAALFTTLLNTDSFTIRVAFSFASSATLTHPYAELLESNKQLEIV